MLAYNIRREIISQVARHVNNGGPLKFGAADPAVHVVELDADDSESLISVMVFERDTISMSEKEIRDRAARGEFTLHELPVRINCPKSRIVKKSDDDIEQERAAELTRILSAALYWSE